MTDVLKQERPAGVSKTIRFTKTAISALRPWIEAKREYVVWAEGERGLGIRISPRGVKSYFFLGRVNGALRRVNLGRVGDRPMDEVISDARKVRAGTHGHDAPAYSVRGIRVREAFDIFLASPMKNGKPRSGTTLSGYTSDYSARIGPALGPRYVSSIVRCDVEALVNSIISEGHLTMAGKVGRTLKAFLNFCRRKGWHNGDDPCLGVQMPSPQVRTRYLSREELAAFASAIDQAEISVVAAAAFKLMLLLGLRRNECLGLKWEHVDEDARCLRIPHAKGKERVVVLNERAWEVLYGLPRLADNPHVLPGQRAGKPLNDLRVPFDRVCKLAGITDLRRHDLRRTFGSHALQSGLSMEKVAALLGHSSIGVTERSYAFLGNRTLVDASNHTASVMTEVMQSRKASNAYNLINLRSQRG